MIEFMFVLVGYSPSRLGGMCQCAGPDARCNHHDGSAAASATTCFSAATLQHLLIAVLAIAGVMTIMMGGGLLFGSGFSAAAVPVARRPPFARDLVHNNGCTLGKRELDPTCSRLLRFVSV